MSQETNVNIAVEEEPKKKGVFSRLKRKLGEKIAGESFPDHISEQWNRIHRVGGFVPILVEGRLELRTEKQNTTLNTIQKRVRTAKGIKHLWSVMSDANLEVFTLFFGAGSQWLRGLSDRETANKVRAYLDVFQRVAHLPAFTSDLFTCSMQMLHISWKPEDVGTLPPYLIETKTIIQPTQQTGASMDDAKEY